MNKYELSPDLVYRLRAFTRFYGYKTWGIDEEGELILYEFNGSPMCVREFVDGSQFKTQFINFQNEIDEYFSVIGFGE